ncbi:MAG: hypothetical protein MRK01_01465 [Candidatus Scalindua sp.]|nr:hypothetical protein [Candidatus Scalindua sp.]
MASCSRDGTLQISATLLLQALQGLQGIPGPQGAAWPAGNAGARGPRGPEGDSHWLLDGLNTYYLQDNVGIGMSRPQFKLSLDNDGGILARGTFGSGTDLRHDFCSGLVQRGADFCSVAGFARA